MGIPGDQVKITDYTTEIKGVYELSHSHFTMQGD